MQRPNPQVVEFGTSPPTLAWQRQILPAEEPAGGTLIVHSSDGMRVRGQHCPACLHVSCGQGHLGASGAGISGCKKVVSSDGLEKWRFLVVPGGQQGWRTDLKA